MGWRVGLTAALIFATFPSGLFWGRNAFWPSQEQFFSLTTFSALLRGGTGKRRTDPGGLYVPLHRWLYFGLSDLGRVWIYSANPLYLHVRVAMGQIRVDEGLAPLAMLRSTALLSLSN